jgi:predicted metal-dependent hydrolase
MSLRKPNAAASTADNTIIPRQVDFEWSTAPLHWLHGDAFGSHAINEFSYLLTEGEKFFCRVFKEALPLVTDDKLGDDVRAFIRQEAVHSRAHQDSIHAYLNRLGIEGGRFDRHNVALFHDVLSAQPRGRKLPRRMQRPWLVLRVGVVAAIEHFTAALGIYALEASWELSGADPVVADLFRWHGAEEVEHRTVAYDLYRHLGGTWLLRTLLMLVVLPGLVRRFAIGTSHLMHQDASIDKRHARLSSRAFWRDWRRSAELGNTPGVAWFARRAVRFLRPGYEPVAEASTEQALAYLRSSPAVMQASQRIALKNKSISARR